MSSGTYSVPSRLLGVEVDVRLYTDHVEVYYKGHLVESMERIRGAGEARTDYRHIIGSLVRKLGAFTVCRVWSAISASSKCVISTIGRIRPRQRTVVIQHL